MKCNIKGVCCDHIYSHYTVKTCEALKNVKGIKVGGHDINSLRCADVLTAESGTSLQKFVNKTTELSYHRTTRTDDGNMK